MQILESDIVFEEGVTVDARDLVQQMLRRDPRHRPSLVEVFNHPWVQRLQRAFNISDRLTNTLSTEASHYDPNPSPSVKRRQHMC